METSVIISTYNQPVWLEKVLWGYEVQTYRNFELIVADDGSSKLTLDLLKKNIPQLTYPVKHVWHEDKGFRKCEILNKAILECSTPYLIFSDGDCIPRRDFVETHVKYRSQGRFLSNGYHKLDINISSLISKEDIIVGRCFDLKWLKDKGMPNSFKNNKLNSYGFKSWLLNTFTPTKATWNGHGSSGWLEDILAVNGFDERMKYGGEDREMGERLENKGIKGKQIRYSTVCLHLEHPRNYVNEKDILVNKKIRKNTKHSKTSYTSYGIKNLNNEYCK